jgi:hypothetical protein
VDVDELATAYLRYFESKRDEDFWAFCEVDDLVRGDAERGWELTRILIDKSTSDEALADVAAGPLEDLLKKHGPIVIDRIENECKENERLRTALSGVYMNGGEPVFQRWYALMWKYGFAEGKRPGL